MQRYHPSLRAAKRAERYHRRSALRCASLPFRPAALPSFAARSEASGTVPKRAGRKCKKAIAKCTLLIFFYNNKLLLKKPFLFPYDTVNRDGAIPPRYHPSLRAAQRSEPTLWVARCPTFARPAPYLRCLRGPPKG